MNLNLRTGKPEDEDLCSLICFNAFREIADLHNFPHDIATLAIAKQIISFLLSNDCIYSVIAEIDRKIIGSNFLWEDATIAGVGPISIDSNFQNIAVGRSLMENVLQRAKERGCSGVRLVQAAYHNRSLSLYTKLGFDAREPLSTLQGPPLELKIPGYRVRRVNEGDLQECNQLCFKIHGHDRDRELQQAIKEGKATLVERHDKISGYATEIGYFGHAVGETNEDLKALIGAAKSFTGTGFLIPTRNSELFRWCLERGLRVVQPMTLMSMGLYNEPRGAFLPSIMY
jgi:GNAT superfamily N-acetyltransferase